MKMQVHSPVGVFVTEEEWDQRVVPLDPVCLCEEHQEIQLPGYPYRYPLLALFALHRDARCRECEKSLAWPSRDEWEKYIWQVNFRSALFCGSLKKVETREGGEVFLTIAETDTRQRVEAVFTAPLLLCVPVALREREDDSLERSVKP